MGIAAGWRSHRFFIALALIAAFGLAWRVTYVLWMRDLPVLSDGVHYHTGANFLADGKGMINPIASAVGLRLEDATHPPVWELTLAGASLLGLRSYLSHQLIACVVGTATIVMTGLAGRAAFGRRAGLIAAAIVAVYANVWLYERELLSEPAAMLGVATLIWLVYRFRAQPGTARAVALGVTLAVLSLTRSEMILLGVILIAPLILARSEFDWRRRLTWLGVAGVSCVVVIAPWAIYNSTRFERPVPLSVGLGATMQTGNCAPTYSGRLLGYAELGCVMLAQGLSPDPSVADGQYRSKAFTFMSDHRSQVPGVVAARLGRTFGVFRPVQQTELETERGTRLWVTRLAALMYWVLVPLGVAGAIIARRRRIPIYPLLVFPVTVILSVVLTIGAVRYRAPAEIPLALLAAVAVDQLIRRWRRRGASAHEPEPVVVPQAVPVS